MTIIAKVIASEWVTGEAINRAALDAVERPLCIPVSDHSKLMLEQYAERFVYDASGNRSREGLSAIVIEVEAKKE